jgi:hypothetical protein
MLRHAMPRRANLSLVGLGAWGCMLGCAGSGFTGSSGAGSGGSGAGGGEPRDYPAVVMSDGPVAYFRFGESSTTSGAVDQTGHHDGDYRSVTLGSPGAIAGDADSAVQLLGTSESEVYLGDEFDFAGQTSFSFELWLKPSAVDDQTRRIVDKSGTNGGYVAVWSVGGLIMYRGDPSTNMDIATLPASGVPLGQFTYVTITFDGAHLKVYRNGIESESAPASASLPDTDLPLVVGEGFEGTFDELAIYDKALPPDRITAHYRAGAGSR